MAVLDHELLIEWQKELHEQESRCPWPGPRPLTQADAGLLCGRDMDFLKFMSVCRDSQIVILHGESGVGKSSLLDAKFLPALRHEQYFVAICRDWGGDWSDPEDYLGANVYRSLPDDGRLGLEPNKTIFGALDEKYGERCILVLDQFEELIRYSPGLLEQVIGRVLEWSDTYRLRIVLSLRSEYLHELRALQNRAKPFSLSTFTLEPVDAAFGKAIALAGRVTSDREMPIAEETAQALEMLWQRARTLTAGATVGGPRIGLLHYQGLLYTLDARIKSQETITNAVLADYVNSIAERNAGRRPSAAEVLAYGLTDSVSEKLDRSRAAAEMVGIDRFLLEGTTQHLASTVSHLSSGGFKLVRGLPDLARESLRHEIDTLSSRGLDGMRGPAGAMRRNAVVSALTSDLFSEHEPSTVRAICRERKDLAAAADRNLREDEHFWQESLREGVAARDADPVGTCVGPMAGQAPAATFIEEVRRFAFALHWLRECDLVRITRPGSGDPMVSLIHDGFGDALERWSSTLSLEGDISQAVFALTSPTGKAFDWWELEEFHLRDVCGTPGQPRVHANLSLQGNSVLGAHLKHMVLVNCDLRGSYFHKCTLEGVSFVNCRLDGSMLSDCTIVGSVGAGASTGHQLNPVDGIVEEPTYQIVAEDLAASFLNYLPSHGATGRITDNSIYSPRVGRPATAARPENWAADVFSFSPAHGGVAVFGSRLSAMTLRGLVFRPSEDSVSAADTESLEDGQLAFISVTGSGLDVVDMTDDSWITIDFSSLRSVSLGTKPSGVARRVALEVRNSAIAQTYFGPGLVDGSARIADSLIMQLWNRSARRDDDTPPFEVTINSSKALDLAGAKVDDSTTRLPVHDDSDKLAEATSVDVQHLGAAVDATTYRRGGWD